MKKQTRLGEGLNLQVVPWNGGYDAPSLQLFESRAEVFRLGEGLILQVLPWNGGYSTHTDFYPPPRQGHAIPVYIWFPTKEEVQSWVGIVRTKLKFDSGERKNCTRTRAQYRKLVKRNSAAPDETAPRPAPTPPTRRFRVVCD